MSKGSKIHYSEKELAWIERNCKLPRKEAHAKFCKKFCRDDVSLVNFNALCKRKGWMTGRDGKIKAGNVSWNKGKKMPFNENSARTQFKKGRLPHNTKYLGHERITKDGYVEINVGAKELGHKNNYILKQRYLWEKVNGELSADMCLKCLDGNRQNCDPSNWEAIPRGALPYLNNHHGYDYEGAPEEVKPAILSLAKVRAASNKANKRLRGEK